ncbi:16S rRNA (adenine(1518)-N(6)/adenine(1519)-N(6))-dimethyltransferase RsmA [Aliamphritea spongicola]|uniref:16S rRNA (adenine(1518)-N(6)/adenine(1519)-N(6))- dimethyltransferase RsmA n=1 Tax=Aliamphritea spongicola TaxID=707589 RepID=UPI00196A7B40|nr:16S rRNA (adenine(1518)-N(6)/adenine(1519)-N(6))-dimethyltransferase RsmA [Aliamphritea spongicola]MBN3563759.1 16S rRNA (adenine(1518)-N(6)/adenine(1519)-N(6))-dimethyltransferase RsmA [Aliamphritea spongicola]
MSKKPVGHKARKRFGQNFLQDQGIIRRIIRSIAPQEDQHLVEIGPGLGAITEELLPECQQLNVVELDRDLIPILRTKFFSYADKFNIHEADALKFDFASLHQPPQPLRVVGNLPYNISTPLIFHLLSYAEQIEDMHFMLQKEVVDRLAAQPGESAYGRLGIMAQYYCHVEPLFIVPPEAFDPAPKVDSAIVRLIPYKKIPHPAKDVDKLEVVVRTAFGQRRKTLRNNLKPLISAEDIQALDIDPGLRPERLSLQEFIRISDFISTQQSD